MAKLHGAKVLSGLGRAAAFTRNVKKALAAEQGEQGGAVAYTRLRIPGMFSEYLP